MSFLSPASPVINHTSSSIVRLSRLKGMNSHPSCLIPLKMRAWQILPMWTVLLRPLLRPSAGWLRQEYKKVKVPGRINHDFSGGNIGALFSTPFASQSFSRSRGACATIRLSEASMPSFCATTVMESSIPCCCGAAYREAWPGANLGLRCHEFPTPPSERDPKD